MPPSKPRHWLFKSEPDVYGIADLAAEADRRTEWDGIRNHQAKLLLRDEVQVGDRVFFHHSNAKPPGIAGTMRVVKAGYPDDTAWTTPTGRKGHDAKSTPESPIWYRVDVELDEVFEHFVPLPTLKATQGLEDMMVCRRGARLSIQPVTPAEWKIVEGLGRSGKS